MNIECEVKFRMGKWYDTPYSKDVLQYYNDVDKISPTRTIHSVNLSQRELRINPFDNCGWSPAFPRMMVFLKRIMDFGIIPKNTFLIDTDDNASYENVEYPLFTFTRPINDDQTILYPEHWHIDNLVKKNIVDTISWENKIDEVFWRGQPTGSYYNDSIKTLDRFWNVYHSEDFISNYDHYEAICQMFQRYRFVKRWHDIFDIGFMTWDAASKPNFDGCEFGKYFKSLKFIDHWLKYKYILSLDGNDNSTNSTWVFSTNSLVISPPTKWTSILGHENLKPWIHFIPVSDNAEDLNDVIKWCKNNDEKCKKIVENAHNYCAKFTMDNEVEIHKRIFKILEDNFINE